MNPPSVDIKDILIADSSLAFTFGIDLFIGKEPGKPRRTATIFDYASFPPNLTMDGKDAANYEYCGIQIRVRDVDYVTGWTLINKIKDSLHGRAQETWGGTLYCVIKCINGPALLDYDANGNARFVVNFNIQRR